MTNSVIKMVQAIEADYGMNPNNWPENDVRLKQIHEWYMKHPDKQKRNFSETDILRIQKSLDEQIPKKKICEIFEISSGKLIRGIEMGILDDTKWKAGKKSNNEHGMNPNNWPENDTRLKALHKRSYDLARNPDNGHKSNKLYKGQKSHREQKLRKAQRLLDTTDLPKYKIADQVGYNKDYFSALCTDGYLDDTKWYISRKQLYHYEYYCDDKLIAKGTINQIAILTGKVPSSIRYCTSSSYKKYEHKHTYRLVKVR